MYTYIVRKENSKNINQSFLESFVKIVKYLIGKCQSVHIVRNIDV